MGNIITAQFTCSGDALINRFCNCIGGKSVYVNKLKQNLGCLDSSVQNLVCLKNEVKTRIDIAERQGMKRLDKVLLWLSNVDRRVEKTTKLMKDHKHQTAKLCLGGRCSTNYVSSYKFGKKVVKRLTEVDDLINQEKEFKEAVAAVTLPEPMVEIPCEPTVGLEQKLDTVCSYLLEEHVGIVGLYGERGVGKTALLMQVNNKICSEISPFDLVIWVAVSKSCNLERIQNRIGKKIGFTGEEWMSKSLNEKAIDILNVLKMRKFVLLLDDIWEAVNLTQIGVPPLKKPNVSKVVFMTRFEKICGQMRAQKRVLVEVLEPDESWRLFSDVIGEDCLDILNSNPENLCLAKELVGKCGGAPRKIVETAQDMACRRTTQDWIDAVQSSTSPMLDSQEEIVKNVIEFEDDEDQCTETVGAKLEDMNVFGSPITDETLREMPQYVGGKRITARDRAGIALNKETEDGKDVKAREYVKHLQTKYGNGVATICLFYNATGCTLKFSSNKDWHGYLCQRLYPMVVENGQCGVFVHMRDASGFGRGSSSSGAIVYRGKNAFGDECDWMLAWDNPSVSDHAPIKVFTEIREKAHFPNAWRIVYSLMTESAGREHHDTWEGCASDITLDDINEPFFKATLSLDLAY